MLIVEWIWLSRFQVISIFMQTGHFQKRESFWSLGEKKRNQAEWLFSGNRSYSLACWIIWTRKIIFIKTNIVMIFSFLFRINKIKNVIFCHRKTVTFPTIILLSEFWTSLVLKYLKKKSPPLCVSLTHLQFILH